MKTAVSIPDDLYRRAEAATKKLGMSRSGLYAAAIKEFLDRQAQGDVRERVDRVHRRLQEALDPTLQELQTRSLPREEQ